MARNLLMLAVSIGLAAGPAGAAVTVIGSSSARLCYEAAESPLQPDRQDLARCNGALDNEALSERDRVATHVNRGILLARQGDVASALADFDRASKLDPNEPEAYLNKALVLTMKASLANAALPLFTVALEKRTRRPALAYFGRAAANEDLGNVRSAYADYAKAAAADPKWAAPQQELARFNVRR